jgi:NADPH:quinone reductase-like Zn-dependent oxidoreductase
MPGCCASASEKVLPLSTEVARWAMVLRMTGLRSWRESVFKLRRSGRPASISVASWRVKMVRIFVLTLPPRVLIFGFFSVAEASCLASSRRCG